jgi:hypothetical protein
MASSEAWNLSDNKYSSRNVLITQGASTQRGFAVGGFEKSLLKNSGSKIIHQGLPQKLDFLLNLAL